MWSLNRSLLVRLAASLALLAGLSGCADRESFAGRTGRTSRAGVSTDAQESPGAAVCGDRWCGPGEIASGCPDDCASASDHWLPVDLPSISDEEQLAWCAQSADVRQAALAEQHHAARVLSDALTEHIRAWHRGDAPARIPSALLPPSMESAKTPHWTLVRPEDVQPEQQWFFYPARAEPAATGFEALYQNNSATHVTYLKLLYIAPFGAEIQVQGQFPHSRQMSFHISGPFDPEHPGTHNTGIMEVPLVDLDIEPEPGHTNPFRPGSDRAARQRDYRVAFDLERGNAVDLNAVLRDPHFRDPGNRRVGGPFLAAGPRGGGALIPAVLWLRYYAPDVGPGGVDPLAGVPLPSALMRLPTGESFWIQPELELAAQRQLTTTRGAELPLRGPPTFLGPSLGWLKLFGIYLSYQEGRAYQQHPGPDPPDQVRRSIQSVQAYLYNQGPDRSPPGDIAHSATDQPYNSYLVRPVVLGRGRLYALTGRLPTTPATRAGEPRLVSAEARYWSICHTGSIPSEPVGYNQAGYGCLMDDELALDESRDYVIVYSRPSERPANARAECGVTWQDFGGQSNQTLVLRWMSIYPDHAMPDFVPDDVAVPWRTGAWSQSDYDPTLVGENRPGVMGPYHPVLHYLDRAGFEALGCPVRPDSVPEWRP